MEMCICMHFIIIKLTIHHCKKYSSNLSMQQTKAPSEILVVDTLPRAITFKKVQIGG